MGGIFAELGLHVTNFDSVVSRFNDELSMKSFVLIDEGMFFGNKGDAERMKTLITEDKARFEQKYQSPEVLPSFHNFLVLSNNMKAVQVPNEERRFFMLEALRKAYTKNDWSALWALVKDPTFQELFFQLLLSIDTSCIVKGQAPMTAFKQRIQARQAPETVKFLKDLLDDPSLMQKPLRELHNENHQMQLRDEFETRGRFMLRHRPNYESSAFAQQTPEWDDWALSQDLANGSKTKELVPKRHVVHCVMDHFKGESYAKVTSDDVNSTMESLGLGKDCATKVPLGSTQKRCYAFPSIEGLRYMLMKQNWLTEEDLPEFEA